MPLYLVRWPTLVASIVRADDEDHLTDILDEVASPTDAVWTEYRGPLWIDVTPGVQAELEGEDWKLTGVDEATERPLLGSTIETEDCDTTSEMFHTVLAHAFPHLYELIEANDAEAPLDPEAVRNGAMTDLWLHRGSGELPAALRELFKRCRGNGTPQA